MKQLAMVWIVGWFAVSMACAQTGVFQAGGRRLYLHCDGKRRGPTVILEAGGGRNSSDWSKVQPEVARFAMVCSYDRDGLGKSTVDRAREPDAETIDERTEDLHRLLQTAAVAPPYIMVGHSAGGVQVRRFARSYSSEVSGMVLVDSAHEEQIWRFLAIDPTSVQGPPADPVRARRGGMLATPGERLVWHDDIPLIVLEHGLPFLFEGSMAAHAAQFEATMHAMQVDLASRSAQGQLRTATKSGHDIMFDQPELVVQAIHDVWGEAGSK